MTNFSNISTNFIYFPRNTILTWARSLMALGFLIAVANLATILIFIINRHLRHRSVYCLINLAVADMLHGLINVSESLVVIGEYTGQIRTKVYRRIVYIFLDMSLGLSLTALVPVSLERVYATFFPFRHRTARLRMYFVAFTISWIMPVLIVITYYFILRDEMQGYMFFVVFSLYLFCLLIIFTSYTAIFVQVKIQAKRLQFNQQQTAAIQIRQKREQHLAMTLFIVTILSLITWLPFIVARVSERFISYPLSFNVRFLLILFQRTNSLINPVVYVFRIRGFRKVLSKVVFLCSHDQQQIHPTGNRGNHPIGNES